MSDDLFVILPEISQLLKVEKQFQVINEEDKKAKHLRFALCIHVLDENKKEFSLLVNHNSNQKALHSAKIKRKHLKSMDHPNIIQYIDDFTLGDYYFLQTERINISLFDWINQRMYQEPINESIFVAIAMQLCDVTFYLNKNKCCFNLQSTLSSFSIDNEMKIKLIHFETPQSINVAQIKSIFEECKEKNELFYYKKDILTMDNKSTIWRVFEIDQWAVGICLYYLSGASTQHILNYISDKESYQYSDLLGFQNNIILFSFNSDARKLSNRPSLTRLLGSLQIQQKKLQQKQSQSLQNLKDIEQNELIKQDFFLYLTLRKQIMENNYNLEQNKTIDQLIEKYGQSDSLLQLQIILYAQNECFEEAISCSHKIIQINPLSDTGYYNLGKIYELKREFAESITFYEKAITINPYQDLGYLNLGGISHKQDSKDAFKYCRQAIEANCNNEHVYYNFGLDFNTQKQYINGIQCNKQAFQINKKDDDITYQFAYNHYKTSQYEKAIRFSKLLFDLQNNFQFRQLAQHSKKSI